MGGDKQSVEASFRSSLEDILPIVERLEPHCTSIQDLLGMCKLALENDGQLRLLMKEVATPKR